MNNFVRFFGIYNQIKHLQTLCTVLIFWASINQDVTEKLSTGLFYWSWCQWIATAQGSAHETPPPEGVAVVCHRLSFGPGDVLQGEGPLRSKLAAAAVTRQGTGRPGVGAWQGVKDMNE